MAPLVTDETLSLIATKMDLYSPNLEPIEHLLARWNPLESKNDAFDVANHFKLILDFNGGYVRHADASILAIANGDMLSAIVRAAILLIDR